MTKTRMAVEMTKPKGTLWPMERPVLSRTMMMVPEMSTSEAITPAAIP
jgi:hypothetical protein